MANNHFYHIFCTSGERVVYEGRFQCVSRKAAIGLLREKIGRNNLSGLTFSVTEIPVDVIKEVVEAILRQKPVPQGDLVPFNGSQNLPSSKFASILSHKRNPHAPKGIGETKRRLGGF